MCNFKSTLTLRKKNLTGSDVVGDKMGNGQKRFSTLPTQSTVTERKREAKWKSHHKQLLQSLI